MPQVFAYHLDFENLSRSSDAAIIQRMYHAFSMSRKPLFSKKMRYDSARVSRQPNILTIHLLLTDPGTSAKKEVAQFCFVPTPDFSRHPVLV